MTTDTSTRQKKARLAILAQFDAQGGLPPHVRIHLEELADVAQRRVLVSNSPLTDKARETALEVCENIIVRDNVGWDFAAWKEALAQEDMEAWDQVILTNSSVVGPIFDIEPIIEVMEAGPHDFWGMVLSKQHIEHLQSYFISFGADVIRSDAWTAWWSRIENLSDKNEVIKRYEITMTRWFQDAGFRAGAFVPELTFPRSLRIFRRVRKSGILKGYPAWHLRDARYSNRSVEFHQELLKVGMPYIKASLLWGIDRDLLPSPESLRDIPGSHYPWDELGI